MNEASHAENQRSSGGNEFGWHDLEVTEGQCDRNNEQEKMTYDGPGPSLKLQTYSSQGDCTHLPRWYSDPFSAIMCKTEVITLSSQPPLPFHEQPLHIKVRSGPS